MNKCGTCDPLTGICGSCKGDRIDSPNCTCPDGKYDNDNSNCDSCAHGCKNCSGNDYVSCTACGDNR